MTLGETIRELKHLGRLLSGEKLFKANMQTAIMMKEVLKLIKKLEVPELMWENKKNRDIDEDHITIQS
mgnify:CR=1 FL=1|tara:strand:- start:243 stop:446 length:204 start_codon:yes stop_codon:yes gene_type:complete